MKKLITLAAGLVAVLASAPALAKAPYVGADVELQTLNSASTNTDHLKGVNLYAGLFVLPNVSLEAGVSKSLEETSAGVRADTTAYNLDALVYVPVVGDLSAIGLAGVVYNTLDSNAGDENLWSYELGAGALYPLTDNLAVRGLVKFNDVDFDSLKSTNSMSYTVGAIYGF